MPYRRLPNTDKARIRSLTAVIDTMRNDELYVPVLSPELYNRAERELKQFKAASDKYCQCLEKLNGFSKSEIYQHRLGNARMYVSHFLIVFNLCVKRGEIKASERASYSLPVDTGEIPDMSSDAAVIRCCKAAIQGEHDRTSKGGMPVFNPTIAKVTVHYDLFRELYDKQQDLRHITDESLAVVAAMRDNIDAIILEVWNAIEAYFSKLEGTARLDACRKYGIIYYFRPGENKSD